VIFRNLRFSLDNPLLRGRIAANRWSESVSRGRASQLAGGGLRWTAPTILVGQAMSMFQFAAVGVMM
jgi:hypothetical protein